MLLKGGPSMRDGLSFVSWPEQPGSALWVRVGACAYARLWAAECLNTCPCPHIRIRVNHILPHPLAVLFWGYLQPRCIAKPSRSMWRSLRRSLRRRWQPYAARHLSLRAPSSSVQSNNHAASPCDRAGQGARVLQIGSRRPHRKRCRHAVCHAESAWSACPPCCTRQRTMSVCLQRMRRCWHVCSGLR